MAQGSSSQLARLLDAKHDYGPGAAARTEHLLSTLSTATFRDAESLLHFHDSLLFLRAFPQSRSVTALAEKLLKSTQVQVRRLEAVDADLSAFKSEEFSGIAGTTIRDTRTFELARWLVQRYPHDVSIEWDFEKQSRRMAVILPQVVPLLADDSFVEADTPYGELMTLAAGGESGVAPWLLRSFEQLSLPPLAKTGLYDGLEVEFEWKLNALSATRTFARRPAGELFLHKEPLIQRKQVSLATELASPKLPLRRLSREQGRALLDSVREALMVRYRELHGTTHGDPDYVYEADAGRGVVIYLWGALPEWRLPLRGYYAGITYKNGVPVNYIEAIGMFEWLEVGFNTFYAFREGETAWIYAKVLHLLNQVAGATCFSVYPYQLGDGNEEAIASGAFWFYRKLGFRPGRPDLLALTEKEEARMARDPKHRTSARTLRQLARDHVFFELGNTSPGAWDTFSTRNIERAVLRHMAKRFEGDAVRMQRTAAANLARLLQVDLRSWSAPEQRAFIQFACVLSLVPNIKKWTIAEKKLLVEIIRAKAARTETPYFRLLQRHAKLKAAFLKLGSTTQE